MAKQGRFSVASSAGGALRNIKRVNVTARWRLMRRKMAAMRSHTMNESMNESHTGATS
jgi:hypothetical protein